MRGGAVAGVFAVGLSSSVVAAGAVAGAAAGHANRAFRAASAQVASYLDLVMQREADLVVSTAAFVSGTGNATEAQFRAWAARTQALRRYPEIVGLGYSVVVPADRLAAFAGEAGEAREGPVTPLGPGGTFSVVPPGRRPYYCLAVGNVNRTSGEGFPAGFDFCAGAARAVALRTRDQGGTGYVPIEKGGALLLAALTPVYRGGSVPATARERRARFLGWIEVASRPSAVLRRVLVGHPGLGVTVTYRAPGEHVVLRAGPGRAGDTSSQARLPEGWSLQIFAPLASASIGSNGAALALLLAGIGLSAALAALVLVLSTSRLRALRLVEDTTAELRHQALHDALTGLPNRALVAERAEDLLRRNRRHGTAMAVLYLDLDEFKSVNDGLGHEVGDRLLVAVAERLRSGVADADTVGRLGGDEFVVLLDGASRAVDPRLVAERVLEVLRRPITLVGVATPIVATTSIGVAGGDRPSAAALLRDADVALYEAKAAGRDGYAVFHPGMQAGVERRHRLELDLRRALEAGELHLAYQPIYDLAELRLTGVEALLRWRHPSLGEVGPDEFVPLLEASTQIVEVGRYVLATACAQVAAWRAQQPDLTLSVNVSGRQLDRDDVVDDVRAALQAAGLPAGALTVEITETALLRDVDTTAARLADLRALGVQVAIDDFGTGYASLAYLQRFAVDCLKIDRGFTAAIDASPQGEVLVHALAQLAKDLGLRTIAEGVETTAQLDRLQREAVDEAQGFLFARPLDPDVIEAQLFETSRALRGPG